MDTVTFLQKILPSSGHYVLAFFRDGMKGKPSHTRCDSIEQLAAAARRVDDKGWQAFHACASFVEARKKTKAFEGRVVQVEATRAQDNVAFTRSQWLDVDVGEGKDYPTLKEAARAVAQLCKTLDLPLPMMVKSGRGLHCYWTFTKDLPKAQAEIVGRAFANALKAHEFRHDPSRTADTASILRPVGTHWRKEGAVEVILLRDAEPIPAKTFMRAIAQYIEPQKPTMADVFGDEWSSGTRSYPPSSALRIVQFCGAMRHVVDRGGDVVEPLWRAMLGVVKHTVEGEDQAHEWSRGAADYDPSITQQKLDAWSGPATCAYFAANCEACGSCPHSERVKSPIQLGYSEEMPPQPKEPEPEAPKAEPVEPLPDPVQSWARKQPAELPFWPKGYSWNGEVMQKAVQAEDGSVAWVPFSTRLVYPIQRHQLDDGTFAVKMCALINATRNQWREFDIPSKCVADARACAAALGAFEIFAIGKNGKEIMRSSIQDILDNLMDHSVETLTYNGFGWHEDGFVLGTTRLTAKGPQPVLLGERVPFKAKVDFGVAGSAEEWAALIDTIYNRPGAEPYQFIILAAFGAPLVKLAGAKMWHGIPIALTGDSGLGKTTTCKVACTIYGDPEHLTLSANEQGTTMNALIKRVAIARNLPIILDEMTGRTPKEMQDMLFALSNGQPKERLITSGNMVEGDLSWDTISFITGNMNITGMLAQLDRVKADATQMRCFEIPLPDDFNDRVFRGINAVDLIQNRLLARQYGAAGHKYLTFILKHQAAVVAQIQKAREAAAPVTRDETRERFYIDCIVAALVGGAIAKKLGLINFDLVAVKKWALAHIKSLRSSRAASSFGPEDYFQAFLSSLHGRTVVTNFFGDARRGSITEVVDESRLRNPIARQALKDRRFLVTVRGFNEWCVEQQLNPSWLRDELDKRGYIVHRLGSKEEPQRIFKGSSVTGTRVRCLEFDYDKIDSTSVRPPLAVVSEPEAREGAM